MESRYTWKNQLLLGLRNFTILAAIVLLLVYLVLISGKAAKQELETLFVEEKTTVTLIDEPIAYGYENGAKIWELRSQAAEQEKETESSNLTRIYELILFKGGEPNLSIRGDNGVWEKPMEILTLTGNVYVESADKTTLLETEVLVWDERAKMLSCPEFVDFRVEDNHILADSLYSDDDLATIDFVGEVVMFMVGLEGENFVTREGDFPVEDVSDEKQGDGMNVLADYVHYDKEERECWCLPFIPVDVQQEHKIDSDGKPLPTTDSRRVSLTERLVDPDYAAALQESVAQLDLSESDLAFLRGETESLEEPTGLAGALGIDSGRDDGRSMPPGSGGDVPGAQSDPGLGGRTPMMEGGPQGLHTPLDNVIDPVMLDGVGRFSDSGFRLPQIPKSDPEVIETVQDYSDITDWDVAENLNIEKFEGDPEFDPQSEARDGFVFTYRDNKKIWCEELYIDLAEHRVEALRYVDGRFRDLKEDDGEPPENRAGRAIQESPTQFIGNYIIHNWQDDLTRGYGRVLVLQADKDFEADNIVYNEKSKVMHAWGEVLVHQYSGEWWETSGAIEDIDEERAREDVKNPSVLTADAMLTYNRVVTWGFGNVVFRQEEQKVTGDRAQYEDETEILIMAGSVDYDSDEGEKISCALLTLDLALDEYIAEGAAIARNIVPEENRDSLAEFKDDEETKPEDDARTRLLESRTAAGLGDWSDAVANPPPPPIEVLDREDRQTVLDSLGPEVSGPILEGVGADEQESTQESVGQTEDAVEPPILIERNEEAAESQYGSPGGTTGAVGTIGVNPTTDDSGDEVEPEEDDTTDNTGNGDEENTTE